MTLLPMSKVNFGLSISRDSLCLVEVRRKWSGTMCRQVTEQSLPAGLIRLSSARPNIENLKEFTDCLRTLVKGIKPPQPIALCLPDLCARTTVFTFSSFPKKTADRDAIVSWRFQQDMNISTQQTRFAYHPYFPQQPNSSGESHEPVHVLASTLQHPILEQYEQACLDSGLLPISVGLAGLDVFDFYKDPIHAVGRIRQHRNDYQRERFAFYLANWGFSFMAFRDGYPVFVRVKSLAMPRLTPDTLVSDNADPSDSILLANPTHEQLDETVHAHGAYTSLEANTVANELVATLQYYFETAQGVRNEQHPIPLYFAEGLVNGVDLLPTVQAVESMLKSGMSYAPPLTIVNCSDLVSLKMNRRISGPQAHISALPAFASVMAA